MPLLNTVIIEHPDDPNNIIKLPKQRRLLVYVERIGFEKFDDSPDAPLGKVFCVQDISKEDFEFFKYKGYTWMLETGPLRRYMIYSAIML
jgi:hypothetical protein